MNKIILISLMITVVTTVVVVNLYSSKPKSIY